MKKKKFLCLTALILTVFLPVSGFAAEDKMILDLHFDEGSGSKTANSADPTCVCLTKKDPEWVSGYRGKALKFGKPGQHVKAYSRKPEIPLESFTFECWIKPEQISGLRGIFIAPFTKIHFYGFDVCLKNGFPMLRYSTAKNPRNALVAKSKESKLEPGVFSHLAIIYKNKNVNIFVNGNLVLNNEIAMPIIFKKGPSMMLIAPPYGSLGFNGVIDELKFYARALSSEEIKEHRGKAFSFIFSPMVENQGAPKTKKWYFIYDHTKPIEHKMLNRCIGFTGKPYDRFTEGEKKEVLLDIKNLTDNDANIKLSVKIDDWLNKEVKSEKFDLSVPAKKLIKQKIDLETGKKGCFILILEVFKNGKKLFSTSKPYAVTVTPDKNIAGKDRPFGHHMHDGVWHNREMPDSGSSNVRFWQGCATWAQIERKKGEFNWEAIDLLVNSCHKKGQNILYTLAYTPAWASSAPDAVKKAPWHYTYRYPPKDIKDWKNFLRTVVRRYKDKVKWWEIWNEPDSSYFLAPPEEYYKMLKSAYEVIKKEDPSAKVVGISGTSQWYDFTKKIFELGGAEYMDVFSVHFYLNNPPEKSRVVAWGDAAKNLLKSFGKENMPIWDTESGYASPLRDENGRMIDVPSGTMKELPFAQGNRKWKSFGERLVAAYLIRHRILGIANGIEKYFMFDQFYMPKGVYPLCMVAHQAMVKIIADNKFLRNIPLGENNLRGYLFSGKNNVAILWSPGAESDILMNCHADKIRLVDFMGNSREVNAAKPLKITLNDYPVYIVGCGNKIELAGRPFEFFAGKKAIVGLEFPVKIKNTSDKKASFTVQLLNVQYKPLKSSKSTDVEAGKEKTVSVMVPKEIPEGDAYLMVKMEQDKTKSFVRTLPVRIVNPPLPVVKADEGDIVVDGSLEDWTDSEKMYLNKEDQVKIGRENKAFIGVPHWEGRNDLSAVLAGRWTDKGLYLAFDVTDNNILPSSNEKTYFSGDCVELFLDFRNKKTLGKLSYEDGVYHLMLVPGKNKNDKTKCVSAAFSGTHKGYEKLLPALNCAGEKSFWDLFSGSSTDPKIIVAGKRTLCGYTVEVFIPLLPELSFEEPFEDGRIIGFDIAIDDADKDENNNKRKVQMIYNGTKANHRDASNFATLKLTEKNHEKEKFHINRIPQRRD